MEASTFHRRHHMSANDRSLRTHSTTAFRELAKTKIRQGIALTSTLLLAISSLAQETSPSAPQPDAQKTSQGAFSYHHHNRSRWNQHRSRAHASHPKPLHPS